MDVQIVHEDDGTPIANNCQPNFLLANTNDGSCQYFGCMDPVADNYDTIYNVPVEGSMWIIWMY